MDDKTPKQRMVDLLDRVPDDATMDEIVSKVAFLASLMRGLEEAHAGEGIPHEIVHESLDDFIRDGKFPSDEELERRAYARGLI